MYELETTENINNNLKQHFSVAIQRANAVCVMGTLAESSFSDLFFCIIVSVVYYYYYYY